MSRNRIILVVIIIVVASAITVVALERGGAFQSETDTSGNIDASEYVVAKNSEGSMVTIPSITYTLSEDKESYLLPNSNQTVQGTLKVSTLNDCDRALRTRVDFQESGTWLFVETMDITTQRQTGFLFMVRSGTTLGETTVVTITDHDHVSIVSGETISGSWKLWGVGNVITNYEVNTSDAYQGFIVLVKSDYTLGKYHNIIKIWAENNTNKAELEDSLDDAGRTVYLPGTWRKWNTDYTYTDSYVIDDNDFLNKTENAVITSIFDSAVVNIIGKTTAPFIVKTGEYKFSINIKYKSQISIEPQQYQGANMKSDIIFMLSALHKVSFDAHSGTGTMSDQLIAEKTPTPVNVCTFTAPSNKVFSHWNTKSDDTGAKYYEGDMISVSDDSVKLYAIWSDPTVTFHANGGDGGSMAPQTIPYNTATALNSNAFTKTGYHFTGWAETPDGSKAYDNGQSVTLTKNLTLYALWAADSYALSWNDTSKVVVRDDGTIITSGTSVEYGSIVRVTGDTGYTVSAVTGLTFSKSEGAFIGKMDKTSATTLAITVAATEYTLGINLNGGTSSTIASGEVSYLAEAITYKNSSGETVSFSAPTRTGYTFDGFYGGNRQVTNSSGVLLASVPGFTDSSHRWIKDSDGTLVAHWTAKTYTVTLDPNEGTGGTGSLTATFNSGTFNTITAPTRAGYTFAGYYTATTEGSKVIDQSTLNAFISGSVTGYVSSGKWVCDSDTTLYAMWTENRLTVTFNANGGTGTMAEQVIKYSDATKTLNTNSYTFAGHTFNVWNTDDGGEGASYTDGADVSALITSPTSTLILYAIWKSS